ncbi:hypothetical protein [Nocardia sp. NPDC058497]|uniref:hypothetical protein n=1 Tax=Nocardia sp. NPDC058497 TaxID=3346529 RepID=UPI003655F5D7
MAQYFKAVFLDADTGAVTGSLSPGISFKLIEHAWQGKLVRRRRQPDPHHTDPHGVGR